MERSIVKRNVLVIVGLLAAVLLSCGIDSKRSVNGPESYGSLAPRMLFKRASTQATVTIPPGVATVSIKVTINSRDTTVTALRSQGYLQITQVPVGNCLVTVVGKDSTGRTIYSGSIIATILENQIAAPDINVTQVVPILLYYDSPKRGMTVSNSSITLTGTVSYGTGHLQAANGFLINGSAAAFSGPVWSKNVTLTEGTNKFAFYIETSLGNILRDTLTVIYSLTNVDTEGPSLNVLQLVDITPSSSINIQGTVSDPSAPVRVTINDVAATVSGSQFALQVALSVGRNTLIIDAYDALNNKTSQTKYVEYNPAALDNIAPDLLVAAPLDNDTVSSRTIRVSGTATDNSGVTVTVNSQLATIDQLGNWSTDVSVDSAVKQIVITATDKSSLLNTVTVIRTIYFDSTRADHTPPVVSIKSPNNLATTSIDSIEVSVEATDAISGVSSVKVNGLSALYDAAQNRYKKTIRLTAGVDTITAVATDNRGNSDATKIFVTYNPLAVDNIQPVINWIYPVANDVLGAASIIVQIQPTDLSGISSVTINNQNATFDAASQKYSAAITLATVGANTITAVVVDASPAQNSKTETISVIYDPTANDNQGPSITITDPVANSTVSSRTYTVKATVTDNSGVDSVFFSALADTSVWVIATTTGNNEYTATVNFGTPGTKILTVRTRDRSTAKNIAIKTSSLMYVAPDITKPSVIITTPASNITVNTNTATIVATITDSGGLRVVKFNNDSLSATVAGSTYTYAATLTAGANVFTIMARDVAGNIDSTKSVTITYNAPPAAPTLFTQATVLEASISLTWSKCKDADFNQYRLYWDTTATVSASRYIGLDTSAITAGDTSRTIRGLTPGTIYYFAVVARDSFPSTAISNVVIDTTLLGTPVFDGITIDSANHPYLRWHPVAGARGYGIYRSLSSNGPFTSISKYVQGSFPWSIPDTTVRDDRDSTSAGTTYYYKVQAASRNYTVGEMSAVDSVKTWSLPVFTTHPVARTVFQGAQVTFTAAAVGNPAPITYQWKRNSLPISGAASPSYMVAPVTFADSGVYTVTATNGGGSVTSNPARLAVPDTILTDIEGNVYHTVIIGNQVWTRENLRVTKYNDRTPITLVTDNAAWAALVTPAYCQYNNRTDPDSIRKWGALYNWNVVDPANVKKIAPVGWHVPTDAEWTTMENYLIANGFNWDGTTTGNKIAKSLAAKTDWATTTTAGCIGVDLTTNNRSGFSALPGSYRSSNGTFSNVGYIGYWWSALAFDASNASYRYLFYDNGSLNRTNYLSKSCGVSVRLVRD